MRDREEKRGKREGEKDLSDFSWTSEPLPDRRT